MQQISQNLLQLQMQRITWFKKKGRWPCMMCRYELMAVSYVYFRPPLACLPAWGSLQS